MDRLTVLRTLHSCGYRYASLHGIRFEEPRTVALFSVPHCRGYRRAFTAFIEQESERDRPRLEVEPGFVIEPIRGKL
jgi:hypothetical protein